MKLDATIACDPAVGAELAAALEADGYDGVWTAETQHDPFLPLAAAAVSTSRVTLGTAIATAFTRSPMVTAMAAWDLQRASKGRFVLGLGTQVRAHNVRRFSVPWGAPAPRLRELVEALRHIWGAFQGEHPLKFRGDYYRHDLITPFFDPGPIDYPKPEIWLAAVTPTMYRLAGEVADGIHVHVFHTVRYLREVALPALGARRNELTLASGVFVVTGGNADAVRMQIAFYGSTPTYRPVFEAHGWGGLQEQLHGLMARGDFGAMAAAIDDEVLAEFAVIADSWDDAWRQVRARYDGVLDRVGVYALRSAADGESREIAEAFRRTA
ncbi:MAG TPA: TIGR03617 family F420-dependent LLM class oxidoreductase [Gaiellaceae bacterium]|nr:TIGR03617 family F420-dependent LLM class oxidoreductase [Gaiellaceae bacterium]